MTQLQRFYGGSSKPHHTVLYVRRRWLSVETVSPRWPEDCRVPKDP